jgi:hypothetical protein
VERKWDKSGKKEHKKVVISAMMLIIMAVSHLEHITGLKSNKAVLSNFHRMFSIFFKKKKKKGKCWAKKLSLYHPSKSIPQSKINQEDYEKNIPKKTKKTKTKT